MTEPYEAYVWAYFTGDTGDSERICLAVSEGNDALSWRTLNGGRPLFTSAYGTGGLRDPFIMRKQDGGFVILATDLNVAALNRNFGQAQRTGSRYLEIWESDDLVNWGEQRHTLVSGLQAGNTWAPEAHWDPETGDYAVYWASNLYAEGESREACTYNRMMIAHTKDFREFSEPKPWVDVCMGNGHDGFGTIDVTVARAGSRWYRFIKDESCMQVREEVCDRLDAPTVGQLPDASAPAWRLVKESVGVGLPNGETAEDGTSKLFTGGEGPCIFPANPGDANGYAWFLFIDQPNYHDGPNHYVAFATNDLDDPDGWRPVSAKLRDRLPVSPDGGKPRHGTVLPITAAERDHLIAAFG